MKLQLPPAACVDRRIARERLLPHLPSAAARRTVREGIASLLWRYKVAPSTMNLLSCAAVPELHVFELCLKPGAGLLPLLAVLDAAIPYHTLFLIRQGDGSGEGGTAFSAAMAYKRMAAAGGAQLVTGLPYLLTDSLAPVALAERLSFDGVAMDHVYHSLLRAVAGDRLLGTEGLPPAEALALMLRREACDQEISRLEARLRREVQPSRQMALFSQLQQLKKQWTHLNTPPPPQTS